MYKTFSRSIDVKRYFHGISDLENRGGGLAMQCQMCESSCTVGKEGMW